MDDKNKKSFQSGVTGVLLVLGLCGVIAGTGHVAQKAADNLLHPAQHAKVKTAAMPDASVTLVKAKNHVRRFSVYKNEQGTEVNKITTEFTKTMSNGANIDVAYNFHFGSKNDAPTTVAVFADGGNNVTRFNLTPEVTSEYKPLVRAIAGEKGKIGMNSAYKHDVDVLLGKMTREFDEGNYMSAWAVEHCSNDIKFFSR